MRYILLLVIFLSGCAVVAERHGNKLILKGYGAKKAKWSDGAEIERQEPLRIPDLPSLKLER
jgi:uncharacterized protein YceK